MESRLHRVMLRGVLASCFVLAAGSLLASPLKFPHRAVNGASVDLTPLFRWWTNQSGPRPLSAWMHITGPILSTNSLGWVVEARSTPGSPNHGGDASSKAPARVVLKHPPLAEAAQFADLQAQLKTLLDSRKRLDAAIKSASQPQAHGRKARIIAAELKEPKEELRILDLKIRDCRTKLGAFPSSDKFMVDCLALDINEDQEGQPVYDYGVVPAGSQ